MLCVPVPGTMSAVAAKVMAAVRAAATPSAIAPRNVRSATTTAREALRMRQQNHIMPTNGRGLANFIEFAERPHVKSLADDCRIRAAPFVGQVESGTRGSARYRKR